ncbi:MAG TPA: hypothetical protein VJ625_17435 [Propionibacteriaceae bacterium]|nr:hypothetical protein [Propionibacteriaceae bacterium]
MSDASLIAPLAPPDPGIAIFGQVTQIPSRALLAMAGCAHEPILE